MHAAVQELGFNELQEEPVATAERIYRHFDLPFPEATRDALRDHIGKDPQGGHHAHSYKSDDFGFSASDVYASVGDYYDRYRQLYGNTDCSAAARDRRSNFCI